MSFDEKRSIRYPELSQTCIIVAHRDLAGFASLGGKAESVLHAVMTQALERELIMSLDGWGRADASLPSAKSSSGKKYRTLRAPV
jgi:hypothetical protein